MGRHSSRSSSRRPGWLGLLRCIGLLAAALLVAGAGAADSYEYDYGYGDGAYGGDSYSYLDDNNYYGNDDESYYEEYGFYADDDAFGYQDYYQDYFDYGGSSANASAAGGGGGHCSVGAGGKVQLPAGTATCDLRITGVDKQADKLPGGLDGVYKLAGCHGGRPMYRRKDSPKGQDRVLYYAKSYADWDVSNGTSPSEDILLYGADIAQHVVPLFVASWQLGGDLTSAGNASASDESYLPAKAVKLACADGTKVAPPSALAKGSGGGGNSLPTAMPVGGRSGPLLTPDEMEAKWKMVIEKYGRRPEPNPTVNFSFVIMLVMVGLTIVLAIPYMLTRRGGRGGGPGKGYAPVSTSAGGGGSSSSSSSNGAGGGASSFAQVIQQSKKKSSGHIH